MTAKDGVSQGEFFAHSVKTDFAGYHFRDGRVHVCEDRGCEFLVGSNFCRQDLIGKNLTNCRFPDCTMQSVDCIPM